MRAAALVALLLTACPGGPETDPPSEADAWHVLAEGIEGGVLLSGWSASADSDLIFVGGKLTDKAGLIVTLSPDGSICSRAVGEQPWWWIHGRSADDWWAVGEKGVVLHHTGGEEIREDLETEHTLFGVYDDGERVWAVGADVRAHTGQLWGRNDDGWLLLEETPAELFKVWDGWVVGNEVAYTWNGRDLDPHPPGERLLTVRGRSADDVWAVGGAVSARVLHWEGESWAAIDNDLGQPLNGVWTAPGEDVWIAGNFGTVARWDGEAWHRPELPPTVEHLHAVWKHGDVVYGIGGNLFATSGHRGTLVRTGPDAGTVQVGACP